MARRAPENVNTAPRGVDQIDDDDESVVVPQAAPSQPASPSQPAKSPETPKAESGDKKKKKEKVELPKSERELRKEASRNRTETGAFPDDPNNPGHPLILDREKNLSKNEDINKLVDQVLSFDFEMNMRNDRFREVYGNNWIGDLRRRLGGEGRWVPVRDQSGRVSRMRLEGGDFRYEEDRASDGSTRGILRHNALNETGRKIANVGLRTLRTAGIGALFCLFTGGVGATFVPSLIGSALGRGVLEGARAAGRERKLREQQEIAKIRYFQKSRELASKVGPKWTEEIGRETEENEDEYNERRNQAITDMVNFIDSYEDLSVDIVYDENQNPIINNDVRGVPLPPSDDPNEPRQGDQSGPAYIRGTELTQQSKVSKDFLTVGDIEKNLAGAKSKWDKWSEIFALTGGLAGVAHSLLHGWGNWTLNLNNQYQTQLQSGHPVSLDVDGNWHSHNVQKIGDLSTNLKEQYIYHFNSLKERMAAEAAKAHPFGGGLGAWKLGESLQRINAAVYNKAVNTAIQYTVRSIAALTISSGFGFLANFGNRKSYAEQRAKLIHNQEQERKRLQPDSTMDQIIGWAKDEHLFIPQKNQIWGRPTNPDDPDSPIERIKIIDINSNGYVAVMNYNTEYTSNEVRQMRLREIMSNYRWLEKTGGETPRKSSGDVEEKKAKDTTKKSGETEESEEITPESESKKIGKYETAGADEVQKDTKFHETFFFEKVRDSEQQMIISITDTDKSKNKEELKEACEKIRKAYEELDNSELADMKSALTKASKAVDESFSFTSVITTNEGEFYGLRANNDKSQLFHIDNTGRIIMPSSEYAGKVEGKATFSNKEYFAGELSDNDRLALFDETLSQSPGSILKNDGVGKRGNILRNNNAPEDQIKELVSESVKNSKESCGIITRFISKEEEKEKIKIEAEATIVGPNNTETKEKIQIADDSVLSEKKIVNGEEKTIFWQVNIASDGKIKVAAFQFNKELNIQYLNNSGFSDEFDNKSVFEEWLSHRKLHEVNKDKETLLEKAKKRRSAEKKT